jgi:predicted metal-dependent phosphoesterase TrpH
MSRLEAKGDGPGRHIVKNYGIGSDHGVVTDADPSHEDGSWTDLYAVTKAWIIEGIIVPVSPIAKADRHVLQQSYARTCTYRANHNPNRMR